MLLRISPIRQSCIKTTQKIFVRSMYEDVMLTFSYIKENNVFIYSHSYGGGIWRNNTHTLNYYTDSKYKVIFLRLAGV